MTRLNLVLLDFEKRFSGHSGVNHTNAKMQPKRFFLVKKGWPTATKLYLGKSPRDVTCI